MTLLHFLNIIYKNLKALILVPLVLAATIFYFTRNEKKVYTSETTIYTGIASGYSLIGSIKADFFTANNAFDNLLSLIQARETKEDVAVSLLAEHLFMKNHDPSKMTWGSYTELKKLVPQSTIDSVVKSTLPETRAAIASYMKKNDTNVIYRLINSKVPNYSIDALNNIKSNRVSSSDFIKISYEANDPFICKHTLELLEDIFMDKYRLLKGGQTVSVVGYFEEQSKKSFARLDSVEQVFLEFNKKNDIINYYEQSKAVANEKEDLYALNHNLEMDEQASIRSLDKVNENIKNRVYQSLYGSEIINEREKLSDVYNKIAFSEAINRGKGNKRELDSLKSYANVIENNLRVSLDKLNANTNTPEGIPTKNVLDEWFKNTIAVEQGKAKLAVMDKRKREFTEEYRKFAPLGAFLKKIERQISVYEQEYLQMLHDLNLAKLSQQNSEITSKLNVVDPPYLPLKPNASKRIILVVVGFLGGFIMVLSVVLGNAFINKTILEPSRAKKMIGKPFMGLYPLLTENPKFLELANVRLMQQVLSRVDPLDKPVYIGFVSVQKGEGKSTIIDMLEQELTNLSFSVEKQLLLPTIEYKQLGISMPMSLEAHQWDTEENMIANWEAKNTLIVKKDVDFVLIEFPPLEKMIIKPGLFPHLHQTILLCRANRIWDQRDDEILDLFAKTTGTTPMVLLNGVETDFAEETLGEVPKKRNALRSFIKSLVKLEFGNKSRIR
ncbi:GumC family protein [Emticicia fluvialis]|uniref:GumC family protein n=1 Tax=Emticicia fluvialis TaxID=2974474 RepID=UPI002165772A|nr:hypothetical protein [Emticicia fluvialis]